MQTWHLQLGIDYIMDIASILGFGAIGLGFLLAFLAYRLLATNDARERPVYIYMVFCLALLGVGAALQYSDNRYKTALEQKTKDYDSLKAQYDATAKNLVGSQNNLTETQDKLSSTLTSLAAAQTALNNSKSESKRLADSMKAIVETLAPTTAPLQQVQGVVTGLACSGGAHGEPMNGGAEYGQKISGALSQISAATKIAQQYVP
jgi:hypothetical protein